jgi:hypothetical protein
MTSGLMIQTEDEYATSMMIDEQSDLPEMPVSSTVFVNENHIRKQRLRTSGLNSPMLI